MQPSGYTLSYNCQLQSASNYPSVSLSVHFRLVSCWIHTEKLASVHQRIKYSNRFSKDRLYLTGLGLRLLLRRPILNLCIFLVLKGHLDEKEHQTASFMWWDKKKDYEFCNKAIQINFSNFSLVSTELSHGSNSPHPSAKICKKRERKGQREIWGERWWWWNNMREEAKKIERKCAHDRRK